MEKEVNKINIRKYINDYTDVYHIVDEDFINKFAESQRAFMIMYYYGAYSSFCKNNNIRQLPIDTFLMNARRRKIKLIQICCPYCGNIDLRIENKSIIDLKAKKYCVNCGKSSASENIFSQLGALIRMQEVYRAGYEVLEKKYDTDKLELICYDVFHMEIIELTCILEATLRNLYTEMIYIKYKNFKSSYIGDIIEKSTSNDFMNVEKANKHYKSGLNINLKEMISLECWNSLIDLVQIRNTVVHNNGMIDEKFTKSKSFIRIKSNIDGNLIFINSNMITNYLSNVLELIYSIKNEFDLMYNSEMPSLIANYYFNNHELFLDY